MTTVRDVAKALNLSITTVSRALDGYDDVAEDTRQRVIETVKLMGYVPNRAARQLRRQRTDTIGYILPSASAGFTNPFFTEFITGLGDEAASNNYDLLVSASAPDSPAEKTLYQRWLSGGKVDGMVLNRIRINDWRLQFLSEQKKPFVSLERSLDHLDFHGIETYVNDGYNALINHLITQGYYRIAFISGLGNLKIEQDRLDAYRQALKNANLTIDPMLIVASDMTPEGGYHAADQLLNTPHPPTAILCVNDLTAIGAMHAIHENGFIVGRDIAVAGFDGIADAAHTQPPLTTLDQPVYDIARQLVKMLLALISGETPDSKIIRPVLLIRASTINQ